MVSADIDYQFKMLAKSFARGAVFIATNPADSVYILHSKLKCWCIFISDLSVWLQTVAEKQANNA